MGQFLAETGTSLGAEDEGQFAMRLLHFRRTFVEKMFAIHAKVEAFKAAGHPLGSYARHYYDLFCRADRPEVLAMLRSEEYAAIKADYDRVSTAHFPKSYVPPSEMSFAGSDALFPPAELRATIAAKDSPFPQLLAGTADPSPGTPLAAAAPSDLVGAFRLPWSHYVQLLAVENLNVRGFYEAEALRGKPPGA